MLNLGSPGLVVTPYNARFYLDQGIAPQVVGYASLIHKEELDQYRRQGYRGDEKVGQSGIEKSMEQYLSGKHGGSLYVVDPNGQIVTRLAASRARGRGLGLPDHRSQPAALRPTDVRRLPRARPWCWN